MRYLLLRTPLGTLRTSWKTQLKIWGTSLGTYENIWWTQRIFFLNPSICLVKKKGTYIPQSNSDCRPTKLTPSRSSSSSGERTCPWSSLQLRKAWCVVAQGRHRVRGQLTYWGVFLGLGIQSLPNIRSFLGWISHLGTLFFLVASLFIS
jgi:hypothetical protein